MINTSKLTLTDIEESKKAVEGALCQGLTEAAALVPVEGTYEEGWDRFGSEPSISELFAKIDISQSAETGGAWLGIQSKPLA